MSQTTNESEDGMMSKDQTDSPLADEGNPESAGGGIALKKGPWTAAEDEILMDYVKKHGEGNWNAVQKHSGLFRCGKSCRLRWANHLRPNLKKGAFTPDEERLIIELHAKMGNKWARMAAHLPGRTDNEIKNYWNTRIKRRQRAGLPLYPPEVCLQAIQEGQQNQNADGIHVGDSGHSDLFETNSYELPDVTFNGLKANQVVFPYVPELNDVSGNSMLMKGLGSSPYHSVLQPTFHCQKRLRESSTLFHHYSGNSSNGLTLFDQTPDDTYDKISQSFGFSFLCDSEPDTGSSLPFDVSNGCHSYINGNFSASKPASGVVKSELPSFQYPETDFGGWGTTSPPQILESVDTFIKSPPQTEVLQSVCFSPRNSGLLDALLHEAKTLSCGKNHSSDKSSNSSADTPGDAAYSPNRYVSETDWDEYGDPISPLAQSAASIFSACTPVSGRGSSSDKHPPFEVFTGCNVNVKSETVDQEYTEGEHKRETCTQLDFSRPDALLGSGGWLGQGRVTCKNQASMTDTIVSFLGDELGHEYHEQMAAGNSTSS